MHENWGEASSGGGEGESIFGIFESRYFILKRLISAELLEFYS